MINRKKTPDINKIDKINFINPVKYNLDNNIPVYVINAGKQDLVKIELIFKAGLWYETNSLTAPLTNKMLTEGTINYTANQIADKIDFYGAFIETITEKDMAYVSLYVLNKYLNNILPVLEEIIKNPIFQKNELSILIKNSKQQLIINNEKVDYIAKTKFNELIFGKKHPYGKNTELKDFDNINPERLKIFHKNYYSSNNCKIIVAGKVEKNCINLINKYFGQNDWAFNKTINPKYYPININKPNAQKIYKKNTLQSGIRIGKLMFNKTNPDYIKLKVLNTILGGYFGSRLMTNIREDKGYTYGIGSALISLQNSGLFIIASELNVKFCSRAINEIYKEIKRLKNELIPVSELNLVKNYMLGNILRNTDGPFASAETFKAVMEYGIDNNYYYNFVNTIKNITPEQLQKLAETYLQKETLSELVVVKL